MKRVVVCVLAASLLAGCEVSPSAYAPAPYVMEPRPYYSPAPEVAAPEPPRYAPPVAAPMPDVAEPLPLESTAPAPAAEPDAPRDPVEEVLLKPVLPGDSAPAQPLLRPGLPSDDAGSRPDTGTAVPLMGFRPMRGQKAPGA